ncbi:MAG: ABC transporter substrate-binding protein [Lachnospiraceae bacterium]|nr:ABC transporter substrate-binding protein [Lachnospiraceae bacterium]
MKKKRTVFLWALVILGVMMAGCAKKSGGNQAALEGEKERTAEDAKGKDSIVCYVGHGFWDGSLDPVKGGFSYGYGFINNGLVRINAQSEYEGDLAESWEISEDSLVYTYKLKEGIQFQNGVDFTAEDVVFTYETVMADQGQNEKVDLSKVEKVEAEGKYTVKFTLREPFSPFFDITAQLGIVPKDGYDSAAFDKMPIGTGAWKVVQYDAEQQLIVEANENYFEGAPEIKRVTFVDMDNEAAFSNAQSGQLDVVMVQPSYAAETIDGMHMEKLETMDVRNISLPCREPGTITNARGEEIAVGNPVTSDKAVRKALSIGINRQEIIDNAFQGAGRPAQGWTSNLIWGNTKEYEDSKTEEAQKLLEASGWKDENGDGIREKDGMECAFEIYTPSDEQDRYMLAAALAENAKKLGIAIEVKQTTWDEITAKSYSQGVVWGFGQYSPMVIDNQFQSGHFGNQAYSNPSGYQNKAVDSLIAEAVSANNQKDAVAAWKETQSIYAEDYPYLYLVNIEHCYFISDRLDISIDTQIPHPHGHGIPIICNMKDWTIKEK